MIIIIIIIMLRDARQNIKLFYDQELNIIIKSILARILTSC